VDGRAPKRELRRTVVTLWTIVVGRFDAARIITMARTGDPDPHAWLRPFYGRLKTHHAFSLLSPVHQFAQLVEAIATEHPVEAEQMRHWSPAAQTALMIHLAKEVQATPATVTLLWRLRKGSREVRCVAQYLSMGIDLRVLEGDGFHRTQLCETATAANILSEQWRLAFLERGWKAEA